MTGLLLLYAWPSLVTAMPLTAQGQLERAWWLAGQMARFRYRAEVVQTSHPTARLSNAGCSPQIKRLFAQGLVDHAGQTMHLKLAAAGSGQKGIDLKVEEGQAYGRTGAGDDWQKFDNPTDLFAPGGNPLGFLVAAENINEFTDLRMDESASDLDDEFIHKFADSQILF